MLLKYSNSQQHVQEIQEWQEKVKEGHKSIENMEIKNVLERVLKNLSSQDYIKNAAIILYELKNMVIGSDTKSNDGKFEIKIFYQSYNFLISF